MAKDINTGDRDCWATPPDIFAKLHARYSFDVDVCATADNAKLPRYITPQQDGLLATWSARNWCNPPYSTGNVSCWLSKAFREHQYNNSGTVMLLNYCCDAEYFQAYLPYFKIVHITPRIQFVPPAGVKPSSNSKGQILAIIGIDETATWWNWRTDEWGDKPKQMQLFEEVA